MAERVAVSSPLGRGSWWWRGTFLVLLVAATAAIPALALAGRDAIEQSRAGRLIGVVSDPAAPGYEVLVEPSPTLLVLQVGADDELESVTFLALSSNETGSALFLPPGLVVDLGDRVASLRDEWRDDGERGVTDAVETLLGVGIADFDETGRPLERVDPRVIRVDAAQWAQLVAPVGSVEIDNPDTVEVFEDGELVTRFAAGRLRLDAEAVGTYLAARSDGESDLNRMLRHERFWAAWIDAVRADGSDGAVPGEQDTGLGRFVRVFADGEAGLNAVRANSAAVPGAEDELYAVDSEWLDVIVGAMVPFPESPLPGSRPLVTVLDGTGTPGSSLEVAKLLVGHGAEIRAIGNGPTFDYTETHILYYTPEQSEAAETMRAALGAGAVEFRRDPDQVSAVTVILGTDVVDGLG